MPDKCCVPGCRGNYESEKDTVSVFKIPTEEPFRSIWLKSIPRKGWVPGKRAVVCEKHFHPACVSREIYANKDGIKMSISRKRPFLLPGAVPSLFLDGPKYFSESSREDFVAQTKENILESDDKTECSTESSEDIKIQAEITFSQNSNILVDLESQEMQQIKEEDEKNYEYNTNNDTDHLNGYEEESDIPSYLIPIVKYETDELDECEEDTTHLNPETVPIKKEKPFPEEKLDEDNELDTSNISQSERFVSQLANANTVTNADIDIPNEDHNRMPQYQEYKENSVLMFACEICNKLFSERNELEEHLDIHKKNCSFSSKSFFQVSESSHADEVSISCDLCGKSFIDHIALNEHSCVQIGTHPFHKSFSRKSILNAQQNAVDRKFMCEICNEVFILKHHLTEHMVIHTGVQPFSCKICKLAFSKKSLLKIHKSTHRTESPFSCTVCNKLFSHSHNLAAHMVVHSRVNLFSCSICKQSFSKKSNLNSHMRTHTKVHSFSCNVCNKLFSQNNELIAHMVTHTRPFCCDVCKQTFSQKHSLTMHMSKHTGDRAFSCDACDKSFSRKDCLKLHVKRSHKIVT
ncbi:hypothetical protein C0J52_14032 [Blattella germanica]|nr:hypothetical protein C0J52_14032 [Blattella germanica]